MATLRTRVTDWSAGELGPNLRGRVDLDKYPRGTELLENFVVLQTGGVRRRPGTRFVNIGHAALPAIPARVRLIPFIFSETDAYALEWTNDVLSPTIRFYKNTARVESPPGTAVQIAHTYTEAELAQLKWVQSADVLFIVHSAHAPAHLDRLKTDGTLWRLRDITFDVMPSREFGLRGTEIPATVTPSAVSGAVTLTASAPTFLAADANRPFLVFGGVSVGARVDSLVFVDSTHMTGTVTEPFANTSAIAATDWKLDLSPRVACTPSAATPVLATATLTLAAAGWRVGDVGKQVHLNGGTYLITGFTSTTVVNAQIRSIASGTTAAPGDAWTLEEPAFSALNGYPSEVAFQGDRLWFFATPAQPQSGWASKTGDYFNFAIGALADDALALTLNSDQVNAIKWAARLGRLLALGTTGEEWVIDPGEAQPLTPDSLSDAVRPAGTTFGSTGLIRPVRVSNALLFVTRSRQKLRELVADQTSVFSLTYVAPDLTLLAEHIAGTILSNGVAVTRRFVEQGIQGEPQQTVWLVREDGTLCSLLYQRDQNVVAWARQIFGDRFPLADAVDPDGRMIPSPLILDAVESVCVIPHPDGDRDQVWLSVKRLINGSPVRHIEVLEERGFNFDGGLVTDATVTYDGQNYTTPLTRSADTGAGVNFTAPSPAFAASDVGAEIRLVGPVPGRALVTGFISVNAVTATILDAGFVGVSNPTVAGGWGLARTAFTGLDHLSTRTVQIVGDGAVYPPTIVVSGAVTLSYAAMKVEIGVGYVSRLKPLPPEVAGLGTIQGLQKRQNPIALRLQKSLGVTLNGTLVPFRKGGDPLGTGVPVFTGFKTIPNLGWDAEGQVEIQQTQPLPLTILGLYALLGTAD